MSISLKTTEVIALKTTRLLIMIKQLQGNPSTKDVAYPIPDDKTPAEMLFYRYNDGIMHMRRQYGPTFDVTPYLLATPHATHLSKTIAGNFLYEIGQLKNILAFYKLDMGFSGYALPGLDPCRFRSGLEFFFTSFADIPVSVGRRSFPLKHVYGSVDEAMKNFDESLERWANKFTFGKFETIPPHIPTHHWWWETTARKKPEYVFSDYFD